MTRSTESTLVQLYLESLHTPQEALRNHDEARALNLARKAIELGGEG